MSASSACCCVAANRQYSKHQVTMAVAWAADKTGETGRDSLSLSDGHIVTCIPINLSLARPWASPFLLNLANWSAVKPRNMWRL